MYDEFIDIYKNANICQKSAKSKIRYFDIIATFDIETSRMPDKEVAFMYSAQWCFDGHVLIQRTWDEVRSLIRELCPIAWERDAYIVIYVHNLGYEFEFLRSALPKWLFDDDIFCTDTHTPLYARYNDAIEFRCSYKLTNMSLRSFLKKYNVENQKTDLDYNVLRYPWTPLNDKEIEYISNDVLGLYEALQRLLGAYNDDVSTVPYTSTGYVRRKVREVLQKNKKELNTWKPNYNVYLLMRRAFRGGDTHANRFMAMETLENVASYDITSSYPYELCSKKFPLGKWKREFNVTMDMLKDLYNQEIAYIVEITFTALRLKDKYNPMPYISYAKCYNTKGERLDNGRILSAYTATMCLTDIDLTIILEDYEYDSVQVLTCYTCEYRPLPKNYVSYCLEQYQSKTYYKQAKDDFEKELYMKSKNMLNSFFGDVVQDPIQDMVMYNVVNGEWYVDDINYRHAYNDYRKKFTGLPYQVGVWVTAYARYSDRILIRIAGDKAAYTDTDNVKILNPTPEIKKAIDDLNKKRMIPALSAKDREGNVYYMGLYDYEGTYDKFITGGAKKYAVEKGGEFEITIAGVPKKVGSEYMGDIKNFKDGFCFKNIKSAIKYPVTINTYNDRQMIKIDGHTLELTSFAYVYDTDYLLSLTDSYRYLIESCTGRSDDGESITREIETVKKLLRDYDIYNQRSYNVEEL